MLMVLKLFYNVLLLFLLRVFCLDAWRCTVYKSGSKVQWLAATEVLGVDGIMLFGGGRAKVTILMTMKVVHGVVTVYK